MFGFAMHGKGLVVLRRGVSAASLFMLAVAIALALGLGVALADEVPSAIPASGDGAVSDAADDRSVSERAHDAIAACISGLFAGWGVADPAAFYASDMLLVEDGSCVWFAYDVYRAGAPDGSQTFLERMERYVTESYAGEEHGLDAYSPTTWARTALVVGSLGANPQAFGTNADGQPANLLSDGLYNWAYSKNLSDQGSNALIYSLQAIDALQVAVPPDATYSARDMLDGLLACQAEDGSFALSPGSRSGSVDLTGMALSALAPYRDMPEVAEAVEGALDYLAEQQASDGGFEAEGEKTSESCAMAIIGLSACEIDVATDSRFIKKGGTSLDALLSFQKADGTFAHMRDELGDETMRDLPTEQALRALLAYEELHEGGDGNVYTSDFKLDVWKMKAPEGNGGGEPVAPGGLWSDTGWVPYVISIGVGCAAALVAVAIIWLVRKVRRKARR